MAKRIIDERSFRLFAAVLGAAASCGDPAGSQTGEGLTGPVYALNVILFDADFEATTYVPLSASLDFGADPLKRAREFAGFQSIAAADGRLLVSGEGARITRYDVTDDLTWNDGPSLSFADYGLESAGFHDQFFLNARTAYATADNVKRVIWDPVEFVIKGLMEDSAIPTAPQDGLQLQAAYNRTSWIPKAGPVMKPFYYRDKEWFEFSPTSRIALYDEVTHAEKAVIDAPCTALENATQDEDGNTYFSTWNVRPTRFLYGLAPEPCFVRVTRDGRLDSTFAPRVSTWAGGRPPMVMRYLSGGKAIASFLHTEEITAQWNGPYDPAVREKIELETHFYVWLLDFEAQTARRIEGMIAMDGQFHGKTIDGRHLVFLPYQAYSRTKIYEVLPTGTAVEHLDTAGWVYDLVRVR